MSGAGRPACVRARIEGRVQGVFFRAWTIREALERQLTGWVRNRSDGSVEALFCGEAVAVETMIAACRAGPPKARVTAVTTEPADLPETAAFLQWPTL